MIFPTNIGAGLEGPFPEKYHTRSITFRTKQCWVAAVKGAPYGIHFHIPIFAASSAFTVSITNGCLAP
jgi:hypothetical protein